MKSFAKIASLATTLFLAAGVSQAGPLTVTTLLAPGASDSALWDINNAGTAVGYSIFGGVSRAVTWTESGGFASLAGPAGSVSSSASGISDAGTIVGSWASAAGANASFIYEVGIYTTFTVAGADDTRLRAISPDGRYISGYYSNASTSTVGQGFVFDRTFGDMRLIGAGGNDFTIAQGVSNGGVVVGSDWIRDDASAATIARPGFMFDIATSTRTDVLLPGTVRTAFRAIDESGVISGWTIAASGEISGFTGYPGALDVIMAGGADQTYIEGSNNAGWLVGTAYMLDGSTRAVLARPVSSPATLALTALGLAGLALLRRRRAV